MPRRKEGKREDPALATDASPGRAADARGAAMIAAFLQAFFLIAPYVKNKWSRSDEGFLPCRGLARNGGQAGVIFVLAE
jgi:hypothetical protein